MCHAKCGKCAGMCHREPRRRCEILPECAGTCRNLPESAIDLRCAKRTHWYTGAFASGAAPRDDTDHHPSGRSLSFMSTQNGLTRREALKAGAVAAAAFG